MAKIRLCVICELNPVEAPELACKSCLKEIYDNAKADIDSFDITK
jgi:hypothetical protein